MTVTPPFPDHAIRDGHTMRILIEDEYIDLRLHCPWDALDYTDGTTPACRVSYGEDGQKIEGERLSYCNLREFLDNSGRDEAIVVPGGGQVEVTAAPFPIVWWWDGEADCYVWTPAPVRTAMPDPTDRDDLIERLCVAYVAAGGYADGTNRLGVDSQAMTAVLDHLTAAGWGPCSTGPGLDRAAVEAQDAVIARQAAALIALSQDPGGDLVSRRDIEARHGAVLAKLRAALARERAEVERFRNLLVDVLSPYVWREKGYPGRACHRTEWVDDAMLAKWRMEAGLDE